MCCASMPLPHVPQQITIPASAPTELRRLADHTNRLLLAGKSVAQPSEPLDERWRREWSALLTLLDQLERSLRAIEDRDSS